VYIMDLLLSDFSDLASLKWSFPLICSLSFPLSQQKLVLFVDDVVLFLV
jgi:hypothetical protein